MPFRFSPVVGDENIPYIRQLVSFQRSAADRLRRPLFSLFIVREVHPMVLRKPGMNNDVHEAAASGREVHVGYLGSWLGKELAVMDHAHPSLELADEDGAVGQKRKRVGIGESLSDSDYTDLVFRCAEG